MHATSLASSSRHYNMSSFPSSSVNPIDIRGMGSNITEINRLRGLKNRYDFEPDSSYKVAQVYQRVVSSSSAFTQPYQEALTKPLAYFLQHQRSDLLIRPDSSSVLWDLTQSIFQRCNAAHPGGKAQDSIYALQEVVSDLYEAFLRCEKRQQVKPPDNQKLPALVKFDRDADDVYTFPTDAIQQIVPNANVAVVTFPGAFAKGGVAAWAALAHETVGHDFLHADVGLLAELKRTVRSALMSYLRQGPHQLFLATYWSEKIDETASDILGLLHLGPAAGIGLIAYFRALSDNQKLRREGSLHDPHPCDILRGFLAAEVISRFQHPRFKRWSEVIFYETSADLQGAKAITLGDTQIPLEEIQASIRIVVDAVAWTRLHSLEGRALFEIRMWNEHDLERSDRYEKTFILGESNFSFQDEAHHVLSGALLASMKSGANNESIFSQMIGILSKMHRKNSLWFSKPPSRVRGGELRKFRLQHPIAVGVRRAHSRPPEYRRRSGPPEECCTIC